MLFNKHQKILILNKYIRHETLQLKKFKKDLYDFYRCLFEKAHALYARLDDAPGGSVSARVYASSLCGGGFSIALQRL